MRAALLLVALAACKSKAEPVPTTSPDAAAVVAVVLAPDASTSPFLGLLDTFEQERDADERTRLALEISREDAVAAGAATRVIALVRAYEAIPNGDDTAASLMMSLVKGDHPPPAAVGWLVLDLAAHGGDHTRFVSFYAMTKLTDRLDEVCALMAELAATPALPDAVNVVARTGGSCVPHLDPVIDGLVRAAKDDDFEVEHFMAARALVEQTPLTRPQLDRLAKAARKARKDAERHETSFADALVRRIDDRR